ncbi:MAG: ATP-binding protein [Gammaproteobacteria bacterium]|nr:ATP-binding protein [Gammaproteobacteria bacterium]
MRLINTLLLMFVILIGFVIINDLYSSYKWNQNVQKEMQDNLKNKVTIAYSVLLNELDKFDHMALIVGELNSKLIPLLEYDNYHSIDIILRNISSLYNIDLMYLIDDENNLSSSNLSNSTNHSKITIPKELKVENNKAELINIPFEMLKNTSQFTHFSDHLTLLAIRSVVKLQYDNGDLAGHIIMLKIINHDQLLLQRISKLVKANISIVDNNNHVILSNYLNNETQAVTNFNHDSLYEKKSLLDKQGNIIARLFIVLSEEELNDQYIQLAVTSFLPLIITSFLSMILFFVLKFHVFDHIKNMINALKKIAKGDLHTRINLPFISGNNNEVTEMMLNFNNTMEKLEHLYIELDSKQNHLEYLNNQLSIEVLERKNAEQIAESANQAKTLFLANMSHEIRTPLNAILAYVQLMQRDQQLTDDHKQAITTIERSGRNLLDMINDILDLSKIESGKMSLNLSEFDLVVFIQDIFELFKHQCFEKKIQYHLELEHQILPDYWVYSDESKLRQILINLISNAIKFTETGHVTIKIDFTEHDKLLFQIIDTGIGIDNNELETIFAIFQQVKDGTKKGGAGLGLAIARSQVDILGGDLLVESSPKKGSRFYFELLLKKITIKPQSELSSSHQEATESSNLITQENEVQYWKDTSNTLLTEQEISQLYESAEFCIITRLNKLIEDFEQQGDIKASYAKYLRQCINNHDMEAILKTLPQMLKTNGNQ